MVRSCFHVYVYDFFGCIFDIDLSMSLCIGYMIIFLDISWWCYVTFGVCYGLIGYRYSWIHGYIDDTSILS